jgi:hypothetical protein
MFYIKIITNTIKLYNTSVNKKLEIPRAISDKQDLRISIKDLSSGKYVPGEFSFFSVRSAGYG